MSYERRISLNYLHVQPVVLGVSIFAFQHKGHVRCCVMGPRDGTARVLADCMGVLGKSDTYVSRHGCDVEKLSSGLVVPFQDERQSAGGDA
jgi:hypothetical protein